MKYRLVNDINFIDMVIPAGTIVSSVSGGSFLSKEDKQNIARMQKGAKRHNHNVRIVAFYYPDGKLRTAEVGVDVQSMRSGSIAAIRRRENGE